jgi:S1-C subfamily serine protease
MIVKDRANGARRIAALTLLALGLSALALAFSALGAPRTQAHADDSPTPAQQAIALDSPAVVRIVSVVDARLTCSACASDGSNIVSPDATKAPFEYYSSGSGAFITPDGVILTADHVVDHSAANPEDVSFVETQAASDIALRYSGNTATQVQQYFSSHASQVSISFTVRKQVAFLSTAYTGPLTDLQHIYEFPILATPLASSPPTQQDTAIVRMDTSGISPKPDFPYLTLATAAPQALDSVIAIAFPADADEELNSNADFTALLDISGSDPGTISNLLTPSDNPGQVTKVDPQEYEVTGIGSNGSSGGPVINDQGQVIGFVDAGTSTERITFIIPSGVVAAYIVKAGAANPPAGQFMTLWSKALTEYYGAGACHYSNTASDLATLNKEYPAFGGDTNIADDARLKAAGESCATATPTPAHTSSNPITSGLLIIGACALAVLALIGAVIFLIIFALRRKPSPKPATVATPYVPHTPDVAQPPAARPYAPSAAPAPTIPAPPSTGVAPWPAPAMRPAPTPSMPTRFCPNGHAVLELDASFCPLCGAPLPPIPA